MASSKSNKLRKRRESLFYKNPYCFYCGTKTKLVKLYCSKPPDNMATIEHIISKSNPLRGKIKGELVLACYKCNTYKGILDNRIATSYPVKDTNMKTFITASNIPIAIDDSNKALCSVNCPHNYKDFCALFRTPLNFQVFNVFRCSECLDSTITKEN